MKHSKGPWVHRDSGIIQQEKGEFGVAVAATNNAWLPVNGFDIEHSLANANRIVECLNACEGIKDPKAFFEAARSMIAATLLNKSMKEVTAHMEAAVAQLTEGHNVFTAAEEITE